MYSQDDNPLGPQTPEEIKERLDRYLVIAEELRNDPDYQRLDYIAEIEGQRSDSCDGLYQLYANAEDSVWEADPWVEGGSFCEYERRIEPALLSAIQAYIEDAADPEINNVPQEYQARAERAVNGPLWTAEEHLQYWIDRNRSNNLWLDLHNSTGV